jgi:uncharacterized protein YjbI with pentapeptide repeats
MNRIFFAERRKNDSFLLRLLWSLTSKNLFLTRCHMFLYWFQWSTGQLPLTHLSFQNFGMRVAALAGAAMPGAAVAGVALARAALTSMALASAGLASAVLASTALAGVALAGAVFTSTALASTGFS